jgi:uracil-DNA glycosylase family 4
VDEVIRNPACDECPLQAQKCVYGNGPMTAEILLVAEAPGATEVEEGVPLAGWTGTFVNESIAFFGAPRSSVRVENVFQGKAPYQAKLGKQAALACGPSIWHVINEMPNIKTVIAFGEAALQELSGYRQWEQGYKRELALWRKASKAEPAWDRRRLKAEASFAKKHAKWLERKNVLWTKYKAAKTEKSAVRSITAYQKHVTKQPLMADVLVKLGPRPIVPPEPSAKPQGAKTIGNFRGSPLWLAGHEGKIRLFPTVHPAAAAPKRQPQIRPLIMADLRKAFEFHRGKLTEPVLRVHEIRTLTELRAFKSLMRPGRIGIDIENSRKYDKLVLIGLGQGEDYGVVILEQDDGWSIDGEQRYLIYEELNAWFVDEAYQWGGHFVSGFDEHKLEEYGLRLRCKWDSLYSFHILHADLGSSDDEESAEGGKKKSGSRVGGYDLGFVTSVLCAMPYHKGVVSAIIDALDVAWKDLVLYCAKDVQASLLAQLRMDKEGAAKMPNGLFESELAEEMQLARIAKQMTKDGIPIQVEEHAERTARWESEVISLTAEAKALVGSEAFNIGSNDQLAKELEKRGVHVRRNTETGNPMLDGNEIEKLLKKYDNPLMALVQRYRRAIKELTGYGQISPSYDGKFHPSWKPHGTVGTRWSSSPNAQNITHEQREVMG